MYESQNWLETDREQIMRPLKPHSEKPKTRKNLEDIKDNETFNEYLDNIKPVYHVSDDLW